MASRIGKSHQNRHGTSWSRDGKCLEFGLWAQHVYYATKPNVDGLPALMHESSVVSLVA
jgi:hypothetical protein